MSIEIIEENDTSYDRGTFLPPVVYEVRRSGRGVVGIVASAFFVLAALALSVCDFVAGTVFLPVSLLLLLSWLINFKKSSRLDGDYGLRFQKSAYLVCAVIMAAFALSFRFELAKELVLKYSSFFADLTDSLPQPLNSLINSKFSGTDTVAAILAISFLCIALSYGSLNRSRHNNLPFTKTVFLSILVNSVFGVGLVFDGLLRIHIFKSKYPSVELEQYKDAALSFIFAAVLLLFAARLLIIYIRMRKVKNAVL